MKIKGYTLIEIIVALAIFAIVATLTASMMLQAFKTKTHVAQEAERMNQLSLGVTLIRRDVEQIINRGIHGNEMRLFPPFIGETNYTEFTRGGFVNPQGVLRNSSLKRVAYLCNQHSIIRRTWPILDGLARENHQDKVIFDHLEQCKLSYVSLSHEILDAWRPYAVSQTQKSAFIPAAIQLSLTFKTRGNIQLLFPIPEGMYGS